MKPALAELKIFFSHIKKLIFRNGIVWALGLHNASNFSADSIRKWFKFSYSMDTVFLRFNQCFNGQIRLYRTKK